MSHGFLCRASRCVVLCGLLALLVMPATADDRVVFSREILPILSDSCFQCHGPDEGSREAELRFDDEASVKKDRDGYQVVKPGDPEASELYRRITSDDEYEQMPPADLHRPLKPQQIEAVRKWIEQGAEWGQHWSFNRVERPEIPGDRHPIDFFIDRQLQEKSWTPAPRADKRTLIRRLTLDLTGLPPTGQQVADFLADKEPGSWERLVQRTLASSAYGERMAWDWLEAARYADSNGYQGDNERTMWPWRDWVIKAFNENMPYDQFTIWQLAGDLLPDATQEQILATAFNRNHMINGEGGRIAEENRVDYVMDMAETMSTIWLGLTLNCCRCHDHKFDPILQTEYYSLNAFFNQTPVTGSGGNPQTKPVIELYTDEDHKNIATAKEEEKAALAKLNEKELQIWPRAKGKKASQAAAFQDQPQRIRKIADRGPERRSFYDQRDLYDVFRESHPEWIEIYNKFLRAKGKREGLYAKVVRVMVMEDRKKPRKTYLLDRGIYTERRQEVTAAVPAVLPPLPEDLPANRLALAQWLVSRDHPLTSRVTVNRFWQMLFGIGLVKTTEDFGVQAEFPYHPDLLDWLAAELMESGWDVKQLLFTILTSDAYTRSSVIASPEEYERDPANRYFARGTRFRLPSWAIRDQALAVSGLLNREQGGKSVNGYQPQGVWEEATFGKKTYKMDRGESLYRRSLYTFWRRIIGPTLFFDTAKRQICEVKVARTNTPMHALTVLNDVTYVEAARTLAERVMHAGREDRSRMEQLCESVLVRPITNEELSIWERSLARSRQEYRDHPENAEKLLALGESERDASLPLEEHAAWTALVLNVLNLDETLTKE